MITHHWVRHRIDGLETLGAADFVSLGVRHRIDGLEIYKLAYAKSFSVRHRIDGLEIVVCHLGLHR